MVRNRLRILNKMEKQNIFVEEKRVHLLELLESSPRRFVELKKALGLESNLLSYNLKILQNEGFVEKEGFLFSLTNKGKYLMPYIRRANDASLVPMPCVATIIIKNKKILIRELDKEPGKGKQIFVGGRIEIGEGIFEACKRHSLDKAKIKIKNLKLICVNNYIAKNREQKVHYVVFFITANPTNNQKPKKAYWKNPETIRGKMYPDNKFVLKEMLNNRKVKIIQSFYDEIKDKFEVVNIS